MSDVLTKRGNCQVGMKVEISVMFSTRPATPTIASKPQEARREAGRDSSPQSPEGDDSGNTLIQSASLQNSETIDFCC